MSSTSSKRTSRSSRQMLDVAGADDISTMLKTLGISPSSSASRRTAPPSPATVVRRQTRSSTSSKDLQALQETTPAPKSRTVSSGTTASTRSGRVSSSSGTLAHQEDSAAPLTAIRRPAQQQASTAARTPSYGTGTPLSSRENHHRTVSSSSHKQQDAAAPTRAKRSIPPPTASVPLHNPPQHTDDEYSALLALLSAKEDEVSRLRTRLAATDTELHEADQRATRLEKDKKELGQQIVSLTKQLASDDTQSLRKQYEMQENLLQGFQRENEKATSEIDQLKKRERQLMEHLRKIYGPTFTLDSELSPGPGGGADTAPSFTGMPSRRLSGLVGHPSLTSPIRGLTPPSALPSSEEAASFDPAALMSQLESVQLLVQRFERRLLTRESELTRKEEEANEQVKRLGAVTVCIATGGD